MLSNNVLHKLRPFYHTTHLAPIKQNDCRTPSTFPATIPLQLLSALKTVYLLLLRSILLSTSSSPPCSFCRSLCLHVKSSCLAVFVAVNLPWPTLLNCSRLYDPPHLCFTPWSTSSSPPPSLPPSPPSTPSSSFLPIDLILGLLLGFFAFVLISSILVLTVCNYLRRLHAAPQPTQTTVHFTACAPATPPAPQVPPSPPLPSKMKHHIYSNLATPYAVTVLFEKKEQSS